MRIKINDKIYRLKEIESGVDSLMELVEEPKYKDGDFVVNVRGNVLIFKNNVGDFIYDHAHLAINGVLCICPEHPTSSRIKSYATEEEKQKMLNALAKNGKRWSAEKLCVEDIPKHKFKSGDKVRIKDGVSSGDLSMKNGGPLIHFIEFMDKYIGKELIVEYHNSETGIVRCEGNRYAFYEGWLEPCEGLKKGDLAIFWDNMKEQAFIHVFNKFTSHSDLRPYTDMSGLRWKNAIKFESKEQFEKLIKGEL